MKDLFAVIVTYHPQLINLKKLIVALREQGVSPVIVDNGTLKQDSLSEIENIAYVINLGDNMGIAFAQNKGISYCKSKNAKAIIFFDQDSEIKAEFIESLVNDYNDLIAGGDKVAVIGPTFIDSRYGFYYKQIRLNKFGIRKKVDPAHFSKPFEATIIISSGSYIPVKVLDDVGFMDEDFFIDYVDTEWCLRAISKGYKIFVSTNAVMEHAIGDKMINIGGLHVPVHSPIRRYYRIRNAILFSKLSHIPMMLKIRDNLMNIVHQLLLILTQKHKLLNARTMYKGIKDGFVGKVGKG
ncbi:MULTISPECIES: rhamnosyltransferase [Klebsiella]|uniref:rhamnosyltransferase n=1 Tax=Klebsiella TaxID=570 RepID=UPI0015E9F34C|nr:MULTISPECIES: rhamnosyltransferase [Klebsiella]MDV1074619.1 rhamnosyltransferase [Klebsiella pasteurii]MDV1080666.1 rhamnosyltransferase [Klebsiella pasteurii]QMR54672.1 rhamnosyltransferase [Klebsiella michiganensis]